MGIPNISKEELEELYWGQKMSTLEIGKRFGCLHQDINYLLGKYGIKKRSQSEAQKLSWQQGKKSHCHRPRGLDHPHWKGGRQLNRGYIKVRRPNHPRADGYGYVFEHIVIWEETHGERLANDWTVHHLNGSKTDNRPENLVALPRKMHGKQSFNLLHHAQRRIRDLEAKIRAIEAQRRLI